MCEVHTGTYVALLTSEKTDFTACHPEKLHVYIKRGTFHYAFDNPERLPRMYYTWYLSLRIRRSDSSQLKKRKQKKRPKKEIKDTKAKKKRKRKGIELLKRVQALKKNKVHLLTAPSVVDIMVV